MKKIIAFVVCLIVTFVWGILLTLLGLDAKNQGLILLICYLVLVRYIWKRIVGKENRDEIDKRNNEINQHNEKLKEEIENKLNK
jgi:hypothetical protein